MKARSGEISSPRTPAACRSSGPSHDRREHVEMVSELRQRPELRQVKDPKEWMSEVRA